MLSLTHLIIVMVKVLENFSLQKLNTFHFDVNSRFFVSLENTSDIDNLFESDILGSHPYFVLGGGSNVLFTRDFDGMMIQVNHKGKSIIKTDSRYAWVEVQGGEEWDELVEWAVEKGLGGLENLSLIPGKVGACPIQNIGAYGVEAKDSIEMVLGRNIITGEEKTFRNEECSFGYRDSVFKREWKNRFLITSVIFKLTLEHQLVTSYGNMAEELSKFPDVNIKSIRQAVISIRQRKLPDPERIGNAGSFFKNPVVTEEIAWDLVRENPTMPHFPAPKGIKIPAAWLIDQLDWKGKRHHDAGVHPDQPLVLVNHGHATGKQVLELASSIKESVKSAFGIDLEMEVNVI
jgi:UDP-N-acetylmuramate dehydrogenase